MSAKLRSENHETVKLPRTKTPESDLEEEEVKSQISSISKDKETSKADSEEQKSEEEKPYEPILSNVARKLPLHGLSVYVEIMSNGENISETSHQYLKKLGATVEKRMSKDVNLLIWKDGSPNTVKKAEDIGAQVVSSLWIEDCLENYHKADVNKYPIKISKEPETILTTVKNNKKRGAGTPYLSIGSFNSSMSMEEEDSSSGPKRKAPKTNSEKEKKEDNERVIVNFDVKKNLADVYDKKTADKDTPNAVKGSKNRMEVEVKSTGRKRGRPRKKPLVEAKEEEPEEKGESTGRKRGRPRKKPLVEEEESEEKGDMSIEEEKEKESSLSMEEEDDDSDIKPRRAKSKNKTSKGKKEASPEEKAKDDPKEKEEAEKTHVRNMILSYAGQMPNRTDTSATKASAGKNSVKTPGKQSAANSSKNRDMSEEKPAKSGKATASAKKESKEVTKKRGRKPKAQKSPEESPSESSEKSPSESSEESLEKSEESSLENVKTSKQNKVSEKKVGTRNTPANKKEEVSKASKAKDVKNAKNAKKTASKEISKAETLKSTRKIRAAKKESSDDEDEDEDELEKSNTEEDEEESSDEEEEAPSTRRSVKQNKSQEKSNKKEAANSKSKGKSAAKDQTPAKGKTAEKSSKAKGKEEKKEEEKKPAKDKKTTKAKENEKQAEEEGKKPAEKESKSKASAAKSKTPPSKSSEAKDTKSAAKKKANGKSKGTKIHCEGLSKKEIEKLEQFCEKHKNEYTLLHDAEDLKDCDIIIIDGEDLPKSVNVALSVVRDKKFVKKEWINECVKKKAFVPIKNYTLEATNSWKNIFQNYRLYISEEFEDESDEKNDLTELLESAGGTVYPNIRASDLCITKRSSRRRAGVPSHVKVLSLKWVIDSIVEGKFQNTEQVNYIVLEEK